MKTKYIGKSIVHLPEVNSTNDYAQSLLKDGLIREGTVVKTMHQTAGRGQRGNSWQSETGKNLTFSLVLFPNFVKVDCIFDLNMAVALAVADVCENFFGKEFKIKWPNDLYIRDHKLGGILIENSLKGDSIQSSIIGIGLNVNQVDFSPELANPSSFKMELNKDFDVEVVFKLLMEALEIRYEQLKSGEASDLFQQYIQRLHSFDVWRNFLVKRKQRELKITGISAIGMLETIDRNGKKEKFGFQEISFS